MKRKLLLVRDYLRSLMREPPIRLLFWALFHLPFFSVRLKATWSACERPQYLAGVLAAADQARGQGVPAIAVIEFGVAAGAGLLILERHARSVEKATGVRIAVFGFDTGHGLPALIGDHRDHPMSGAPATTRWMSRPCAVTSTAALSWSSVTSPRRYRVSWPVQLTHLWALPPSTSTSTRLRAITRDALKLFSSPERRMLHRVFLYFDDIMRPEHHAFASERLAISEFNAENACVKIEPWYGLDRWHPFPDRFWLRQMFIAHDLEAISSYKPPGRPPLPSSQP
ncbi:MAG: hypothetical protein GEU75_13500 [Dehalococcoidia bacterium]|nr:hypothetical protein [Dehalococcoidia bacterium]